VKPPDFVFDVFLKPGDFYFGDNESRIRTLLGSCVAITVWHPQFRIGGMCHYLLPEDRQVASLNDELDGRYADKALQLFMHEIRNAGTHPCEYEVKMFGGGNQFSGHELNGHNIPEKNIQSGKKLLLHHGFKLSSFHLGGNGHRNVILDLWSGNVWVQHVNGN
jgi:chemotaxis protein CheD